MSDAGSPESTMLFRLLLLALILTPAVLLYTRFEYQKRGKLSALGLALVMAMIFVPNLMLDYAMEYEIPSTLLDFVGVVVGIAGTALCVVAMVAFRSPLKILCLETGPLSLQGPYRWSRNPQYIGFFMFLAGFALNDWSSWCLVALVIVATYMHLLILIEEEHLARTFGEQYAKYKRTVPRYI